jgi:hypothetical protein
MRLVTLIIETVVGFVFAIVGYLDTATLLMRLASTLASTPIGEAIDKPASIGLIVGAPLFCAGGICVADGLITGFRRFTIVGLLLAMLVFGLGLFCAEATNFINGNVRFLLLGAALALLSATVYQLLASKKGAPERKRGFAAVAGWLVAAVLALGISYVALTGFGGILLIPLSGLLLLLLAAIFFRWFAAHKKTLRNE